MEQILSDGVSGEKNAIKVLFGAEVDKFTFSKCAFHREMLFG